VFCNNSLHPCCKRSFHNQPSVASAAENERLAGTCASLLENVGINPCSRYLNAYGEDRVRAAPAVSCAMSTRKCAHEHTGSAGASRPSLRNGFTACFVLSPENGSFASVAREMLSPLADLTPAPQRQNHTTSPYASATLVSRGLGVHRIPPRIRDDRERPSSCGDDGRSYALDLGEKGSEKFLLIGNYRLDVISVNPNMICPSGSQIKFVLWRSAFWRFLSGDQFWRARRPSQLPAVRSG
jgi:hypothetical protein